ncbi:hypothetical protein K438DRAFT_1838453 [Mycena galopus ATCC 62051]|nr:hypothetical protein K438DRAFT_1838453 [Mycena galopus ATCC 62051]
MGRVGDALSRYSSHGIVTLMLMMWCSSWIACARQRMLAMPMAVPRGDGGAASSSIHVVHDRELEERALQSYQDKCQEPREVVEVENVGVLKPALEREDEPNASRHAPSKICFPLRYASS